MDVTDVRLLSVVGLVVVGIVTVAGTVASPVSLLARVTTNADVRSPLRVTVPVAAPAPAPSDTLPGFTDTVRAAVATSVMSRRYV